MAGLVLLSTADVMEKTTRLRSSEKTSTCLEDTRIFLGVSDFVAGGGAIKGTESAKLKLNP